MPQEYLVKYVKETGMSDDNGNKWYNINVEGDTRGIMMLAKKPPVVGEKEFGVVEEVTKKSGDGTYTRFYRKNRQEALSQPDFTARMENKPASQHSEYNPDGVAWGNALTNATTLVGQGGDPNEVINVARILFEGRPGNVEVKTTELPVKGTIGKEEEPLPEPQGEINMDDIDF